MDKIDLILYILVAIFSLNIISAIVRSVNEYFFGGDRLHSSVRREIDRGEFAKAIDICQSSLEKRPYDSQLLWFEAEALFRLKKFNKSLEKFEYIVEHEPLWAEDARKYIDTIKTKA